MDLLAFPNDIITEITLQDPFIIPMLSCTCKQLNILMRSRRLTFALMRARFPIRAMICLPKPAYARITFGDDFVALAQYLYLNNVRVWLYKHPGPWYLQIYSCIQLYKTDSNIYRFREAFNMFNREDMQKTNMIMEMVEKVVGKELV